MVKLKRENKKDCKINVRLNEGLKNILESEAKKRNETMSKLTTDLLIYHFIAPILKKRFEKIQALSDKDMTTNYTALVMLQNRVLSLLNTEEEIKRYFDTLKKKNKEVLELLNIYWNEAKRRLKRKKAI